MDIETKQLTEALEKAIQASTDAPQAMGITYDENILMKTFQYSPLLQFLEGKGRCTDVNTANVAFFKESPTNTASFINETEDVPEYAKTTYTEVADRMKVIAEGIKISDLAQRGTDKADLLEREIQRAYFQVNSLIDTTLLNGLGTTAAKDFARIQKDIPAANKQDLDGAAITEGAIDDMLVTIIDDNDGHPDAIVTDSFVAKQLKSIAAPYRRYNDKVDIGLGFRVITYESPDGIEVPIIVDKNMPVSSSEHSMLFLDSTTIDVKYLMRPSLIPDLARTGLYYSQAVASYVTAYNVAPFRNGIIEGIGAPSTSSSGGSGSP